MDKTVQFSTAFFKNGKVPLNIFAVSVVSRLKMSASLPDDVVAMMTKRSSSFLSLVFILNCLPKAALINYRCSAYMWRRNLL